MKAPDVDFNRPCHICGSNNFVYRGILKLRQLEMNKPVIPYAQFNLCNECVLNGWILLSNSVQVITAISYFNTKSHEFKHFLSPYPPTL